MTARDLFSRCTHEWLRPIATTSVALLLVAATVALIDLASEVRVISQQIMNVSRQMESRNAAVDRQLDRQERVIEDIRRRIRESERGPGK